MRKINTLILILISSVFTLVFSQETKIETVVQKGHIQPIAGIAYHPSGKYFATGGLDNSIKIWDVSSGKLIRSINIHTAKVNNLEFK